MPRFTQQGKAFDRDMDYIPDRITKEPGRSQDEYGGAPDRAALPHG